MERYQAIRAWCRREATAEDVESVESGLTGRVRELITGVRPAELAMATLQHEGIPKSSGMIE
jgi:hypothetical protein